MQWSYYALRNHLIRYFDLTFCTRHRCKTRMGEGPLHTVNLKNKQGAKSDQQAIFRGIRFPTFSLTYSLPKTALFRINDMNGKRRPGLAVPRFSPVWDSVPREKLACRGLQYFGRGKFVHLASHQNHKRWD